ncbi:hypothetical protein Pint_33273 [Pistacia integerrima]|uniref:Uncharacterized protein n=1 Tax=Pistacia integerrima TaxID=434235 RepID=A0ACC0X5I7_9ROSI|nr:hypothetical protein Pint_33273 [Pistacia integerrima]
MCVRLLLVVGGQLLVSRDFGLLGDFWCEFCGLLSGVGLDLGVVPSGRPAAVVPSGRPTAGGNASSVSERTKTGGFIIEPLEK